MCKKLILKQDTYLAWVGVRGVRVEKGVRGVEFELILWNVFRSPTVFVLFVWFFVYFLQFCSIALYNHHPPPPPVNINTLSSPSWRYWLEYIYYRDLTGSARLPSSCLYSSHQSNRWTNETIPIKSKSFVIHL